jgi:D-alanine-D-alanine ligase-like ATP-grasp enzyme
VIFLTATPHQGRDDTFKALLEIVRPDQKENIDTLSLNPEIIGEMVFRNYKAMVTDQQGSLLFHGVNVNKLAIGSNDAMRKFDQQLRNYLKKGFNAESQSVQGTGRAIGFVMTIYRKLAASSAAAIHKALVRRLAKLEGLPETLSIDVLDWDSDDERYQGELEEMQAEGEKKPFFWVK